LIQYWKTEKPIMLGVRGPQRRPTNGITDYHPFVLWRFAPSNTRMQPMSRKPDKPAFLSRLIRNAIMLISLSPFQTSRNIQSLMLI
jgi:hypothetical protein